MILKIGFDVDVGRFSHGSDICKQRVQIRKLKSPDVKSPLWFNDGHYKAAVSLRLVHISGKPPGYALMK